MSQIVHSMVEEIELSDNPRAKAVLRGILEPGEVWDKLPVKQVDTLEVKNRRWKSLPSTNFAFIGDAYGSGGGKTEAVSFGLKTLGHDLDIPMIYDEQTAHIIDPRALQTEMVLTSLSYMLNDTLFNGDESSDPRRFDGLKVISAGLPSRQLVDGATFSPTTGASFLDLRNGGADSATRHGFLDSLAKCHRRLERDGRANASGGPDSFPSALMVMNENLYDLVEAMIRREGLLRVTTDQFDRTVNQWRNMPFVDAGFKDMDGTNYVLANDHDVPGAATPTTSIYFMLLDPEKHIGVLQLKGLDVRKIGELQSAPINRYRIDWSLGVVCWGKRSLVRLKNLRVA